MPWAQAPGLSADSFNQLISLVIAGFLGDAELGDLIDLNPFYQWSECILDCNGCNGTDDAVADAIKTTLDTIDKYRLDDVETVLYSMCMDTG